MLFKNYFQIYHCTTFSHPDHVLLLFHSMLSQHVFEFIPKDVIMFEEILERFVWIIPMTMKVLDMSSFVVVPIEQFIKWRMLAFSKIRSARFWGPFIPLLPPFRVPIIGLRLHGFDPIVTHGLRVRQWFFYGLRLRNEMRLASFGDI